MSQILNPNVDGCIIKYILAKVISRHLSHKRKHPDDPKRFKTNFVFFAEENRKEIQKQFPSLSFKEIGSILGEKWRSLTPKEKEVINIIYFRNIINLQIKIKEDILKK